MADYERWFITHTYIKKKKKNQTTKTEFKKERINTATFKNSSLSPEAVTMSKGCNLNFTI